LDLPSFVGSLFLDLLDLADLPAELVLLVLLLELVVLLVLLLEFVVLLVGLVVLLVLLLGLVVLLVLLVGLVVLLVVLLVLLLGMLGLLVLELMGLLVLDLLDIPLLDRFFSLCFLLALGLPRGGLPWAVGACVELEELVATGTFVAAGSAPGSLFLDLFDLPEFGLLVSELLDIPLLDCCFLLVL